MVGQVDRGSSEYVVHCVDLESMISRPNSHQQVLLTVKRENFLLLMDESYLASSSLGAKFDHLRKGFHRPYPWQRVYNLHRYKRSTDIEYNNIHLNVCSYLMNPRINDAIYIVSKKLLFKGYLIQHAKSWGSTSDSLALPGIEKILGPEKLEGYLSFLLLTLVSRLRSYLVGQYAKRGLQPTRKSNLC